VFAVVGQNDLFRKLTSFFLTYLTLYFHVPLFKARKWPRSLCSADFPAKVCISLAKCDLPCVIWNISRSFTCLLRCFCLQNNLFSRTTCWLNFLFGVYLCWKLFRVYY